MRNLIAIFIRSLSHNDVLFIQAANKYGIKVIGNIIDNDEDEIAQFKIKFPEVKILNTKTAYQQKISFWLSAAINHIQIEFFRFKNRPHFEFRNPRFTQFNLFFILVGCIFKSLRPHLRFYSEHWNKDLYLNRLKKAGLPVPEIYATLKDNQEPNPDFFNLIQYPCVCKPSSYSGGYGVYFANGSEDIERLYSYEQNQSVQSDISLYYRNKTERGVRNYIYNSCSLGGRYLFQQFIPGRVFSISASLVNKKLISVFCYEIHSADNIYFAEQGFSWPIKAQIESEIITLTHQMIDVLKYPDGPIMADLVYDQKGHLYIIDAGPRASLTASKLSQMVHQDNWHAECLVLATRLHNIHRAPSRKSRPIFWQRMPLPKGQYEFIHYPVFDSKEVIYSNLPVQSGSVVYEARTDRQMIERGEFATTGLNVEEAQLKWNSLFKEIKWKLKS